MPQVYRTNSEPPSSNALPGVIPADRHPRCGLSVVQIAARFDNTLATRTPPPTAKDITNAVYLGITGKVSPTFSTYSEHHPTSHPRCRNSATMVVVAALFPSKQTLK